jgi:hypothetical protein
MLNAISIKIPMVFLTDNKKYQTLNFIWKHKKLQIANIILSKESNMEGIIIPDFKLYYNPYQ